MNSVQQAEVLRRLLCAAGHLSAAVEMVETAQPCGQVLQQLNTVQSALHTIGIKIIHWQAQSSQHVIINSGSFQRRSAELKRLQSLYTIFVEHFNHTHEVFHD